MKKKLQKLLKNKKARKYLSKMATKVLERIVIIGILYALFRLFNVSLKAGF